MPCLAVDYPGPQPGAAKSSMSESSFTSENATISMSWKYDAQTIHPTKLDFLPYRQEYR